ncbi:hypothetical protein QVD17_08497 [Tagetes erecta]|uniref:Uncharacterized protein n=1 Tax=Tagetes erecta TaxID=13708 RepID=A0AAD8L2Z8_TARER|nr:hypothetical protein QVD17_08497 [Tagetes erecta]
MESGMEESKPAMPTVLLRTLERYLRFSVMELQHFSLFTELDVSKEDFTLKLGMKKGKNLVVFIEFVGLWVKRAYLESYTGDSFSLDLEFWGLLLRRLLIRGVSYCHGRTCAATLASNIAATNPIRSLMTQLLSAMMLFYDGGCGESPEDERCLEKKRLREKESKKRKKDMKGNDKDTGDSPKMARKHIGYLLSCIPRERRVTPPSTAPCQPASPSVISDLCSPDSEYLIWGKGD